MDEMNVRNLRTLVVSAAAVAAMVVAVSAWAGQPVLLLVVVVPVALGARFLIRR